MKVNYDGHEYEFDLDEIDVNQACIIKAKCNLTLMSLEAGLMQADPHALKAIFWLMLVQSGDTNADIDRINFKIVKFANALQEATKAEEAAEKEAAKAKKAASRGSSRA